MNKKRYILILGIALLSMGTVLKKKDPVLKTQTGPIRYSEKAKEEAEGKKGPPVPTLELYPQERFLVEGPVKKGKSSPVTQEESEAELWLEEETEEEGEIGMEEGLWDEGEEGGEFKLQAQKDDTGEKPAKNKPGFLDTTEG